MKIGVIADTHTAVSVANHALEYLKSRHCDLIIHAGDIVELATLKILKRLRVPYVAVIGNNDTALLKYKNDFNLFFQPHIFEFGGLKFKLMHHPFFFDETCDIAIYGHTHYFAATNTSKTLFLNPGEICARKKPFFEFAYICVSEKNFIIKKVISPRINSEPKWQEQELIFER